MEGQVFILVIMVVAGLVSMVKKAIAEEKKKQEALIRAAQARKKQATAKPVAGKRAAGQGGSGSIRRPELRDRPVLAGQEGVDQERLKKAARDGMDQERQKAAEKTMAAKPALQPPPPVVPALPEQPAQTPPIDFQEQLLDRNRVLELFVMKEVLDRPVALRRK